MSTLLIPESEDFLYWDPETIAWYPNPPESMDGGEEEETGT